MDTKLFSAFLFIVIVCGKPSSQNIDRPDNLNGFEKFIIGTSKSAFASEISPYLDGYEYLGQCCKTIFGSEVWYTFLKFNKSNKLSEIEVYTRDKYYSRDEIEKLISLIKSEFGTPAEEKGVNAILYTWKGDKVSLVLHFYISDYTPLNSDPIWSFVFKYSAIKKELPKYQIKVHKEKSTN